MKLKSFKFRRKKLKTMKEQIEDLLEHQRMSVQEIFEESQELSKINLSKLSKSDKSVLEDKLLLLEQEYSIRNSFISDLIDILG